MIGIWIYLVLGLIHWPIMNFVAGWKPDWGIRGTGVDTLFANLVGWPIFALVNFGLFIYDIGRGQDSPFGQIQDIFHSLGERVRK